MKKIFLTSNKLEGEKIFVNSEESNHIMNSLRHKIGDKILVSNEIDKEYLTKIIDFEKGQVVLKIEDISPLQKSHKEIVLVQGLCKGEKMDFIIQKATELGVKKIIPLETRRTIVKYDKIKGEKRVERWQKIAAEAAKQSNASLIPQVSQIEKLKDFGNNLEENTKYILFWEDEDELYLKDVLSETKEDKLTLIIGPEGGFDEQEVRNLEGKGVITVSLGNKILRTETAALAATTCVMYHFGELG